VNLVGWHSADTLCDAPELSALGPVPLELDPRWLRRQVDGPDKRLQCFLLGEALRPRGYAPFLVHRGSLSYCLGEITVFSVPVLRYSMRDAPLCEDRESLAGLFAPLRAAIGRSGVVFFEGVRTGSPLGDLLTLPESPVRDLFHVVPYGPTYLRRLVELPTGAQFADYLQTLGSNTRKDIRRTRKNFQGLAGNTVRIIRYTEPGQANALAAALAQVSRKTYQYHLLGLGLENSPESVAQFHAAAAGGWLRAYVLWIGETPVAFKLGYHDGNTYYSHHIGYDPERSKLQPGIYLHAEVMADLLADGICRFDFLSGDSLYKQRLSNSSREERHYYLIPRGWPGTASALTLVAFNVLTETIGRWLDKSGLKQRIRRITRIAAVKRGAGKN
jgi:hypothetical protein